LWGNTVTGDFKTRYIDKEPYRGNTALSQQRETATEAGFAPPLAVGFYSSPFRNGATGGLTSTLKTWRANYYSTRNTLQTVTLPFALGDRAEETVCLIVDARCEEERVSRTRQGTIAEAQCPQAVDRN
jgi:hypothetical protein